MQSRLAKAAGGSRCAAHRQGAAIGALLAQDLGQRVEGAQVGLRGVEAGACSGCGGVSARSSEQTADARDPAPAHPSRCTESSPASTPPPAHRQLIGQPRVVDARLGLRVGQRGAAADDALGEGGGDDLLSFFGAGETTGGSAKALVSDRSAAGHLQRCEARCHNIDATTKQACAAPLASASGVTSQITENARRSTSALRRAQQGAAQQGHCQRTGGAHQRSCII